MCTVENVYLRVTSVLAPWTLGAVDSMENMPWAWYYNGDLIIPSCDRCNIAWRIAWASWAGPSDPVEATDTV